jgi:HAD superfamily 5'-nucleotidase-like hydrolase
MPFPSILPLERGVFCNRTLDLQDIKAIGYDMDYTLVHYRVEAWEQEAYRCIQEQLLKQNWPVEKLSFEAAQVCRGLIMDRQLGNLIKANRFGIVERATHGTRPLTPSELRQHYAHLTVKLSEPRWVFLNTLFSLSEGCLYAQLVDLLDAGALPTALGYSDLYQQLGLAAEAAHTEGVLKSRILSAPDRYVEPDPEIALTLLDQKQAGKKLLLITNSDWAYTVPMMKHAVDPFLPSGMSWQQLFDMIIFSARKPDFFTSDQPFYEVVTEDGLLRPHHGPIQPGSICVGGSARRLEKQLGVNGDEILYIGDHMFGDVHVTKNVLRWRTALILRELEADILSQRRFPHAELESLEREIQVIAAAANRLKLQLSRIQGGYGPPVSDPAIALQARLDALEIEQKRLNTGWANFPGDPRPWGALMRSGRDKSHLAFQVERYADIYTSRVSNLLAPTPFACFQSMRLSLPHDG